MAKTGAEVVDDGTGKLKKRDNVDLSAFDDDSPGPGDDDVGLVGSKKDDDKGADSGKDGDKGDGKGETDAEKAANKILARLDTIDGRLDKIEGKSKKSDDADDGDGKGNADAKKDDNSSSDDKIDKLADTVGTLAKAVENSHKELAELRKSRGASNALDLDPVSGDGGDDDVIDWQDLNAHRRQKAAR